MDYEKAYKNALVRAKAMIKIAANKDEAIGFVNTIFPEFKDSSLKNRVQPQQKQEWSEEDEQMCQDTIQFIETGWTDNDKSHLISWLKSLKDRVQPHWKPTEEQMSCFRQAIDLFKMKVNDDLILWNLHSLYDDLKKL